MLKNKHKEIIIIVMVTLIVVLTALNSTRFYRRLDLTEHKIFTISDTTRNIIRTVPETVRITFFLSDRIRPLTPTAVEIEDILYEYAAQSDGRVVVRTVDPGKMNLTRLAETLDIRARQIEVFEQDQRSYALVYSGIAIQYLDSFESIPFILNTDTLEYEVTRRIKNLVEGVQMRLGLLSGDVARSIDGNYSYLYERLGDLYDVEIITPGTEISPDYSAIAVLGNRDLTEEDLRYIDDYIMEGGKVLFCLQGIDVDMATELKAESLGDSPALAMMENWGIRINDNIILDKSSRRITLRGSFPMDYPQWIGITGDNVSRENPITSRFAGLDLLWASSIDLVETDSNLDFHRLLATTDQAWLMEEDYTTDPYSINAMLRHLDVEKHQFDVGYVVSGNFRSAFTDKVSPETRMIVISDNDFASNLIEFSDSPQNIYFLENTFEWLASDETLLDIRTRSRRDMRLSKITSPEGRLRAVLFIYFINLVLVPAAVIIYALARFFGRKRKKA